MPTKNAMFPGPVNVVTRELFSSESYTFPLLKSTVTISHGVLGIVAHPGVLLSRGKKIGM